MMVMVVVALEVDRAVVAMVAVPLEVMAVAVAKVTVVIPVVVMVVPRPMLVPLRRGGTGDQDEGDGDETRETCLHEDNLPVRE